MAMTGRGGAAGVWSVYEDFKPNSEWQQDAHSHNLIISLPGFMREQLRVSTEGRNIVRVRGERLIAGNKWSRFLEDFEVPEDSDMNSVRAKFHEGALTITIPKKTIDKAREDEKRRQVEDRGKEASSPKTMEERMNELSPKDSGKEGKEEEAIESNGSEDGAFNNAVKGLAAKDKGKEVIESSGAITKAVKGGAELNEERKLMVNVGVAVLVIVSFSAYVTYKFVAGDDKK
ncbi:inactive protein RESTRICTED TEV MOVEMENT 2-like [Salvia divinorum]|uniref:Inactive protein RESTRICTED TEV MOVEMENT 2-like n=1 Tax=Salvia divinorum TaxID=28513 RepID=A0ABD1FW29_SALDI